MVSVSTDAGAYQDLEAIRERVEYDGGELFNDNEQLRFDQLLVRLERESRKIFETLWGDQTPLTETDRVDTERTTDDAAMLLVYPVNDVSQVEIKRTLGSDWDTLDADRYTHTKHRLVLANRRDKGLPRRHSNPLTDTALRTTWSDIAAQVRVTYDRGFGAEPPADIQSVQIAIINRMLRQLRNEQTVAAADPEQLAAASAELDNVVTEDIRQRIDDVTSPGGATLSV